MRSCKSALNNINSRGPATEILGEDKFFFSKITSSSAEILTFGEFVLAKSEGEGKKIYILVQNRAMHILISVFMNFVFDTE